MAHLLARSGVAVASAGIEADEGRTMDRAVRTRLEKAGGSGTGFVARQLTIDLIASAGLVLGETRRVRGEVAQLHYPAVSYCFTLGDFADLVRDLEPRDIEGVEGASWVAKVAATAGEQRGYVPARARRDVDLQEVDGAASVRRMARRAEKGLPRVVTVLTPPMLSWEQRTALGLAGPSY